MWMTTMNPETRRLIRVMPTEAAATAQVFDLLLGENAQGRKEHIAVNGYKIFGPGRHFLTSARPLPQERRPLWTIDKREKPAGPSLSAAASLSSSPSSGWAWPWLPQAAVIILGGRCPHCGKILPLVPTSATQCPRCHGSPL